ncbi:hypothetical protein [Siccirubricoccus phaeus]|uniref:hypothetical protein n=1 Tax=Siccirubricoccus phaeus TaxID=2595053 RepID=UPI0011F1F89D|nr:hypothetical protein [Siccirubricoccus phaeus]
MRGAAWVLAWLWGLLLPVLAQPAPAPARQAAALRPLASCALENGPRNARELYAVTAEWPGGIGQGFRPPVELAASTSTHGAAAGQSVQIEIEAPQAALIPPAEWLGATFLGTSRRAEAPAGESRNADYAGLRASVLSRGEAGDGKLRLRLQVPPNRTGFWGEHWLIAIAACDRDAKLIAYGTVPIAVAPSRLASLAAIALTVLLYALVALGAWFCNADRVRRIRAARARASHATAPPPEWQQRWRKALGHMANPVFVTQDASGYGSLARLQLLLFTLAVGFVSTRAYLSSGAIPNFSTDVLWLLGIAVGGTSASRLIRSNAGLTDANRLWLLQSGVLEMKERLPQWRDVIAADGEIDVTRVQAVVFTTITVLALVVGGSGDLSNFRIPEEVQYLLGLSQLTYIAGKAIPSETMRQLDQALTALRQAEAKPDAGAELEAARRGAAGLLRQVFGDGFSAARLAAG